MYNLIESFLLHVIGRNELITKIIMYLSPIHGLAFGIVFSITFTVLLLSDKKTYIHALELYDKDTKRYIKAFDEIQITCHRMNAVNRYNAHVSEVVNAKNRLKEFKLNG